MTIKWSFSFNSFVKLSLYNTVHIPNKALQRDFTVWGSLKFLAWDPSPSPPPPKKKKNNKCKINWKDVSVMNRLSKQEIIISRKKLIWEQNYIKFSYQLFAYEIIEYDRLLRD